MLIGGGIGCFVLILIIVLVGVFAGGSDDGDDDDSSKSGPTTSKPSTSTGGNVMKGATYKRIPSTRVEVPIPPGWRVAKRGLYSFAISPDKKAMLAFTTVSSRGEFRGRTLHAWRKFKITGCTKGPSKKGGLGPDKMPSSLIDYECNFNGVPSYVSTVLVNAGQRAFPFVIYAVEKSASKRTFKQAKQTVLNMRKR